MTTTWWHIADLGWLFQSAHLPVVELDSSRVVGKNEAIFPLDSANGLLDDSRRLDFRPWTLADALVRASTTEQPGVFHRVELGLGAWLRFRGLLSLYADAKLGIDDERFDMLRDSMRTASSGELGQAVCWLAGLQLLKCRQLIDFGQACEILGRPVPGSSDERPDYLGLVGGSPRKTLLLESKGHIRTDDRRNNVKDDLRGALNQCWAGVQRLRPISTDATHAVVAALYSPGSGGEESLVYICDPEDGDGRPLSPEEIGLLMRAHYAAWATAAGAVGLSRLLLSGDQARDPGTGFTLELEGRQWFFPAADAEASPMTNWQRLPPDLYPLPSLEGLVRGIDLNLLRAVLAHPARAAEFDDYPKPQEARPAPSVADFMPDGTVIVSADLLADATRVS